MSTYEHTDDSGDKIRFNGNGHDVLVESDPYVSIPNADAPTVALELLKAAGQESVIVPKGRVGEVIETASGHLMIDGQTLPPALSFWEASEGARDRQLADAFRYAAKVDAALAFVRAKAAREAAEKAEAETAEKKLQERRDAAAASLGMPYYVRLVGTAQRAVDRILELEDRLAAN